MTPKIACHIFFSNIKGYENINYKIKKIHNGFTNISFLLSFENGEKFQIRIGYNNDIVDRKNEFKIIKALNLEEYLYYNPKNGNAVKKWLPGNTLNKKNIDDFFIENFCKKVDELHQVPIDLNKHDYFCFIDLVNDQIEKKYLDLYRKIYSEIIDEKNFVTSHNDLNADNLIINNKNIYFIDFEWCKLNDPLWDYCNFIREVCPNKKIIAKFIKHLNVSFCHFYKFMYLCTCFALQWTYATKPHERIVQYREKTLSKLKELYDLVKH